MSQAIIAQTPGGPEVLQIADVEKPVPGPGQLLVKVAAAGINYIETYQREGIYPVALPFTPGAESAGTVEALGEGVSDFAIGDRVATAEGSKSYAEYTLIDAQKALPVPQALDLEVAAALPLQGMTAHYLINSSFKVEAGHTILTHAGAGGVGLLLSQLLKAKGATVITTVSTAEKAALAKDAGADHVLHYQDQQGRGFAEQVREITDGRGVDAVLDGVGKDTFDGSLATLAIRGTLVLYGAASGPVPPLDIQRLNSGGSLFLTRPTLAHHTLTAEERRWRASEIFDAADDGSLRVRIGGRYPLAEAAQAHRDLQGRKTTGKLLLLP
ncbi:NADPH2:quinone reductase [Psychromicrobium silvestre]|uniref:NADPH2:quinone reductase n=1 Tax=Psychromicrobium silvestre TaxID=1645614 RepID=A0A7Y9S528_9MICC|nr:quinone oxidoreductase [Psychromicrobium silvestre]NYE93801.1 NADPH2:quinone reductase [Psychromicrobium silvestre]